MIPPQPSGFHSLCSHTNPPFLLSPTWLPLRSTSGGGWTQRETITQVALSVTWMYLSLDPQGPWQEANLRPSDPLWWPFLSPRCLTGRKDAVCCPQAPLTCSPLLSPTKETILLIPGLFLHILCLLNPSFCLFPFPPSSLPSVSTHFILLWHTSYSSFVVFSVPLWDVSQHCKPQHPESQLIALQGIIRHFICKFNFTCFWYNLFNLSCSCLH